MLREEDVIPRIELVRELGVPPLLFGMTISEARVAMQTWGTLYDTPDNPSGMSRLNARDDAFNHDIYANFEGGDRVTSIEIWRPEHGPDSPPPSVVFGDIDIFALPADEVVDTLRQRGHEVDATDVYFPFFNDIALGFNRSGGDEVTDDDEGLALFFRSVVIAPPGYYD